MEDGIDKWLAILDSSSVIPIRCCTIIERSREIVNHSTIERGLRVACYLLCQVARREQHVLHLMDITVLTGFAIVVRRLRNDSVVEHIGSTFGIGLTGENLEVTLVAHGGDVVVHHILAGEVHHHRRGVVANDVDTMIEILRPVLVTLGHLCLTVEMGDGVNGVDPCLVLHGIATHDITSTTNV